VFTPHTSAQTFPRHFFSFYFGATVYIVLQFLSIGVWFGICGVLMHVISLSDIIDRCLHNWCTPNWI